MTESNIRQPESVVDKYLLFVFKGGNGLGQILYLWALVGSLLSALILTVCSFIYSSWWLFLLVLLAVCSYVYLGRLGRELLGSIWPRDR
ncbi:hypothetical protein [Methylophaga nitratireducenticrescens]|uniref:Uncharacterized protein n=1 Tax=Methylophaga nitratireducenticrescens TaxID=754476 RepID=I1XM66_METNJ|nr:hypothetical protein [Methylophaga nitratireducenticrescens]AFI85485.1 hypothetical protein Q7A_2697 [Methylophaga nitratireducenticrescens]AUZ85235.1 hypothetical protein CDW43_11935 [Methylophaga nitratireducenticrescens]